MAPRSSLGVDSFSVVPEKMAIVEIVEDSVVAERKAAESNHDGDQLFQPPCVVGYREINRRRNENNGVVCVVELDAIAIYKSDSRV
jgi:hypothetical protein